VNLAVDNISELNAGNDLHLANLTSDISALASHGIDQISLDHLSTQNLESLLSTPGQDGYSQFDDFLTAVNTFDASAGAHASVTLSFNESAVHALVAQGYSFATGDHIGVDYTGAGTHLSSSLQDLSSLHVNQVNVSGGLLDKNGVDHISVDLGSIDLNSSTIGTLASSLPVFELSGSEQALGAHSLDVTLDMTAAQASEWSAIEASDTGLSHELISALQAAGITNIDPPVALDQVFANPGADWMNLSLAGQLHSVGIGYQEEIIGSSNPNAPSNLNNAFDQEISALEHAGQLTVAQGSAAHDALTGLDLLSKYTSPDKFGDLLHALTASGVSDFVVESGNVQIGDGLAAALVDAGMLQALPAANLTIDATAQVMQIGDEYYGHMATSLKAIADLGVHTIETGNVSQLYVDLGLPVHDANAMSDISQLLNSLDPANHATQLAHNQSGHEVGISLVISGDIAAAIQEAGGFTTTEISQMKNLGINQIAVLGENANVNPNSLINSKAVAQTAVPLPEVKLIGHTDPMYDELHEHHMPHGK